MSATASSSPINIEGGLDLSGYPPPPVLWVTALVDTFCYPLQCTQWRESLGVEPDSWLSHRVPALMDTLPGHLAFQDFWKEQQQMLDQEGQPTAALSLGQAMYKYSFETSSTALGDLTTPTAAIILIGLVLCLRSIKSVVLPFFSSLGRSVARKTHGVEWEAANEERIAKFGEYVFRLIYHSSITVYAVWYFWDKSWWSSSTENGAGTLSLFQGFPYHPVEPGMAWYYLLQGAYNLDAMVSLLVLSFSVRFQSPLATVKAPASAAPSTKFQWPVRIGWSETVRGDFQEMMIHHVVTNLLIIGSSMCRLTRIGSMVFLVHDMSDVPVDLSKLANFLKWKWTTLACFLTMVGVWLATRLYILPFTIYRAILTQSQYALEEGLPVILYVHYRHFFYVLVGLLILLHVAWFVMFLQILTTFVKKSECHDLSEHKNGEKQHGSNKIQTSPTAPAEAAATATPSPLKPKRLHDEASEEKKDN